MALRASARLRQPPVAGRRCARGLCAWRAACGRRARRPRSLSKRRSGRSPSSWARVKRPVATATATAPKARAQSTSWGVSPITITSSATERVAAERVGAARRQRREPPAIGFVGAEGAEDEVGQEPRGAELDARALLDIAREEAEHDPVGGIETAHQIGDAGHRDHVAPVADLLGQALRIGLEVLVEPLLHQRAIDPARLHQIVDDPRVGLARHLVGVDATRSCRRPPGARA